MPSSVVREDIQLNCFSVLAGTRDKVDSVTYEVWKLKSVRPAWLFATHRLKPTRLLCPWNSPGKNIGVGFHSLLQGIFWTQGLNHILLHDRQILLGSSLSRIQGYPQDERRRRERETRLGGGGCSRVWQSLAMLYFFYCGFYTLN